MSGSLDDWMDQIGQHGYLEKYDLAVEIHKNSSLLNQNGEYFSNMESVEQFLDAFTQGVSFTYTEMPYRIQKQRYLLQLSDEIRSFGIFVK